MDEETLFQIYERSMLANRTPLGSYNYYNIHGLWTLTRLKP